MKLSAALLPALLIAGSAGARTFYVSTQGNDGWGGILPQANAAPTDGPFASPARALQAARDFKKNNPGKPATILVREGTYYLDSTLDLFGVDSGLTLAAYPGEIPVLSGGRRITGWKKAGDRLWEAPVPGAKDGTWDFRVLTVNGELRPRARLPEKGYFTHLSRFDVRWMGSTGGGWQVQPSRGELTHLKYDPDDLGPWLNLDDAEISVYHMWDMSLMRPVADDENTHTLAFAYPGEHPPGAFGIYNYVVWNVAQGLTRPGQWVLDRTAGKLLYWPPAGEDPAKARVLAPGPANLVRVSGYKDMPVSNVTLRGFSLTLANAPLVKGGTASLDVEGALELSHTRDCLVEGLHFFNEAGWGIQATGSDGLTVKHCSAADTGGGGIRAEGAGVALLGNRVEQVGLLYPSAVGMFTAGGAGARILHNTIENCPYDGILNNSGDSLIEKNRIDRVMQELHDGGAVYSGFCRGVTIRGNWASNITDMGGYGSSAYYLDEQSTGCVVEDNLSVNVARPSQNHMAHDNLLRHNLFLVTGDGQMDFARCKGYTLEGNVVYAEGKFTLSAPLDGIVSMPDNLLYSAKGEVDLKTLADYNVQGEATLAPRDGTLLADPRLQNTQPGRYGFNADSPALKLGIRPFDDSTAGIDR